MLQGPKSFPVKALLCLLAFAFSGALAASPKDLLLDLDEFPHAKTVEFSEKPVLDHQVGLGAIQKVRGVWEFRDSERLSGTLTSYSWQIIDGFTSMEVMENLVDKAEELEGIDLLFSCDGRSCGRGVQWANRVFHQSFLYGREDLQRYRVYNVGGETRSILIIYASARTADRQYLHAEVLEVTP
jgi:hypothetical protein